MIADNAVEVQPDRLSSILREVTDILTNLPAPNTPKIMDRLPVGEGAALTQQFAHKGIVLSLPSSISDEGRGRDLVRVAEELRITGLWRIKPKDQTADLYAGLDWEEQIAATIRNAPTLRRFNPTYRGSNRAPSQVSQEWWIFTLTFQLDREIR